MLTKISFLCTAFAVFLQAQTPVSLEVIHAQEVVNQLEWQVKAGIVPRQKLEQAEQALTDARDQDLLARLLGNVDLTEDQATELKDAAQRRLDRTNTNIDKQKQLVDAGIEAAQTIAPLKEEKEWAQTQYDQALLRADAVHSIAEMARVELQIPESSVGEEVHADLPIMERFDGDGVFKPKDFEHIQTAYEKEFHKPLPVSADGETAVHRALGFDHRNRVDVALFPDAPEGVWLRHYLENAEIPYYAFRGAVAGKATGAHIHIGPPSTRL